MKDELLTDNKSLLKKIGLLEKELLLLKSQVKEQNYQKISQKKRKKSQVNFEVSPFRSASKKTNFETSPDAERTRPLKCFSKSSGRTDCLEASRRGNIENFKSRKRSESKDVHNGGYVKEKKKQKICKTCLRLMSKGYATKFCPKHGNYVNN
jgi:hypothetical protein